MQKLLEEMESRKTEYNSSKNVREKDQSSNQIIEKVEKCKKEQS